MKKKSLTYKKSGVDIKRADTLISEIKKLVKSTHGPEVLKGIGGFGGFFKFDKQPYNRQ